MNFAIKRKWKWMQWCMPEILELRREREENQETRNILSYMVT